MAAATERIPVLVTAAEKGRIARMAKAAGMSMGEYLRRAASTFRAGDDDTLLLGMIAQMEKTTARANESIDAALAEVEASNQRIAALETRRRKVA